MPKFLLSLVFTCFTIVIWGQDSQQEKLELRKSQIQKEIIENEKQLQFVKKKEKTAVNVVVLQTNKIKLKENLIHTTEKQTKLLGNDMYINQIQVNKLNKELSVLKEDYSEMIVKSYKSRSEESKAMFILSSESFLQAYKRLQYMKQYTNYRKMQGDEIQIKTKLLTNYYQKLDIQKTAKQKLIVENEKERLSLESEKQIQQELVNSIKKDKNKIIAEIKKKQMESRAIDKKIDRLIREAIAEANKKAAKEKADKIRISKENAAKEKLALEKAAKEKAAEIAKLKAIETTKLKAIENSKLSAAEKNKAKAAEIEKTALIVKAIPKENVSPAVASTAVSTTVIDLTPSGKIISDNFRANKGRLPWPVASGKITLGYGDQPHPVYKTLTVHNSGLEITTNSGANAIAVFAGEVSSVFVLSPVNKAVMIKHGDFFTVYQNLSSVNVSKGDKVSIKQNLGQIRTNGEGKTILKFTLSQNTSYTNPKVWLSPR